MSPVLFKLVAIFVWGFWAICLTLALWRGDRPARQVALVGVAAFLAGWIPQLVWGVSADVALFADALTLVPFVLIALRTPRPWLISLCAFQTAAVATYVVRAFDPNLGELAFATAVNSWAALVQASLLWGTLEAERRRSLI